MTSTAVPHRPVPSTSSPRASGGPTSGSAARADQRYRTVQFALFVAGAVLMPLGIVAILIAWYGTAHAKYAYDQATYLISGGVLGLGLVFLGGFLYFGAWLAKVAHDQRESALQLADTMLVLADLVSRQAGRPAEVGAPARIDAGAVPVLAGDGSTVHRSDCALIAHRTDLHVLTGAERDLGVCRVCRPSLV